MFESWKVLISGVSRDRTCLRSADQPQELCSHWLGSRSQDGEFRKRRRQGLLTRTEIQQERLQKSSRSIEKVVPGASACDKYAANCGLAPRRASVDGSPGAIACEKYAAECGLAPRRASLCSLDIIAVRRKSCYTIPAPPQYVVRMHRSVHYRYTCNDHLYSFRTSHGTCFADVAAVGLQQR